MKRILLKANMRRHRGSLLGIFVLIFLSALFLTAVLAVWHSAGRFEERELARLGYGDITAWVSGDHAVLDGLSGELETQEAVETVSIQPLIFSDYEINGQDSDSEGQLLLYEPSQVPYRFFSADLSGYGETPEQIGNGADDFVVQAQREGHGASRYAGNDIGDADDHAFDDVKYKSHFVHLIFLVNGQVYTIPYSGHSFNENFQLLVAWNMKNVYNSKLL